MFELVEIDRLVGAADNLRRNVNVTELAASIRSIGVLEPLLVTPAVDGFAVVAGHRRLAAARKAGLEVVPCVVREMSEVERVIAMVVENEQRSDLSPIESAEGYFRLIDMGITQKELAKKVGRSASMSRHDSRCWSCLAPFVGAGPRGAVGPRGGGGIARAGGRATGDRGNRRW